MTTLKKNLGYALEHKKDNEAIIITKRFEKAANTIGSDEYKALTRLRNDFPDYAVVVKESVNRKQTYKGLTIEKMREIIIKEGDSIEIRLEALEKATTDKVPYPAIKKWFLSYYENCEKHLKKSVEEEQVIDTIEKNIINDEVA